MPSIRGPFHRPREYNATLNHVKILPKWIYLQAPSFRALSAPAHPAVFLSLTVLYKFRGWFGHFIRGWGEISACKHCTFRVIGGFWLNELITQTLAVPSIRNSFCCIISAHTPTYRHTHTHYWTDANIDWQLIPSFELVYNQCGRKYVNPKLLPKMLHTLVIYFDLNLVTSTA